MKRVILLLWLIPFLLFGQARNTITNDGTKNSYWYVGMDANAKVGIGIPHTQPLSNTLTLRNGGTMGNQSFVPGWQGMGWKLTYQNGEYTLNVDNLDIRGIFSAREFLINQLNVNNGNLLVSSAAKVDSIGSNSLTPYFIVENVTNHNIAPFQIGDMIEALIVDPTGKAFTATGDLTSNAFLIKRLIYRVTNVVGLKVYYASLAGTPINVGIPEKGDTFVRIGSLTNIARQGLIGIYSDEQYSPYIRVSDSLNSWAATKDFSKIKVQLGRLYFTSPIFGAIDTYGLYAKGSIYLEDGFIAMSDSGYIQAGKSTYSSTVAGFYLGNDLGIPKFNIGNTTKYLKWDGNTLDIKGNITLDNQSSISISGFNNDAGFITTSQAAHTFYQSSAPTTMVTGDFWFNTTAGEMRMKRYNGTSWATSPYISVYIDANGLYAGNITAGQVTAGTFTGLTYQTAAAGNARLEITGGPGQETIHFYSATNALQAEIVGGSGGGIEIYSVAGKATYAGYSEAVLSSVNGPVTIGATGGNVVISASVGYTITLNGTNVSSFVTGTPWTSMGYLITETDPTIYSWAKAATKPTYTYSEVGAVSTTDSRLSDARVASDVYTWAKAATKPSYSYSEVGAAPSGHGHVAANISDFNSTVNGILQVGGYLTSASSLNPANVAQTLNYKFVTDTEKATWNSKENILTFSAPLSRVGNVISVPLASSTVSGYLGAGDWSTFNGKENVLTFSAPLSRSVNTISISAGGITSSYTSGASGSFAIANIASITITNGLVTSVIEQ